MLRLGAVLLGLLVLTYAETRVLQQIHQDNHNRMVDYAQDIPHGRAALKAYQSRIAGPYLVEFAHRATGVSFNRCYRAITITLLLAANALAYVAGLHYLKNNGRAWTFAVAYAALFVAVGDDLFLYIWDYIDMVLLLAFAWAIFARAPLWVMVVLFVLELTNREAAIFIPMWIAIDAGFSLLERGRRESTKVLLGKIGLAGVLFVGGSLWTHWVRATLLRHDPPEERGHTVFLGQHWQWDLNREALLSPLTQDGMIAWLVGIALVILLIRAWRIAPRLTMRLTPLMAIMGILTLLFAVVSETRVFFGFIPFGLFLLFLQRPESETSLANASKSA